MMYDESELQLSHSKCVENIENFMKSLQEYVVKSADTVTSLSSVNIESARMRADANFSMYRQNFINGMNSLNNMYLIFTKQLTTSVELYSDQFALAMNCDGELSVDKTVFSEKKKNRALALLNPNSDLTDADNASFSNIDWKSKTKHMTNFMSAVKIWGGMVNNDWQLLPYLNALNLDELVKQQMFTANITHVDETNNLVFYVQMENNEVLNRLKRATFEEINYEGTENCIVGIALDDQMYRAIALPMDCTSGAEQINAFKLIDYGNTIECSTETYIVPAPYSDLPVQAIRCVLDGIKTSSQVLTDPEIIAAILQKSKANPINLEVLMQKNHCLHVIMHDYTMKDNWDSDEVDTNANSIVATTIEPCMQIPEYGECGDILEVKIIHMRNFNWYKGIIVNEAQPICWTDEDITVEQIMKSPPITDQLVIGKYSVDGLWYRGKVLNANAENDAYEIIFVDYGNTEYLPLALLAHPNSNALLQPFRTISMHFTNVLDIVQEDDTDRRKFGKYFGKVMIEQQTFQVKYIEQDKNGEAFVKAIDEKFQPLFDILTMSKLIELLPN